MKIKEANAFEEQLLKEKMDKLYKKLHQAVETSQEHLPTFQESPEVCVLYTDTCHAIDFFLFICSFLGPIFS